MNWVSKKLVLNTLRSYFVIENQNDVSISLIGKKQIKCYNLYLKPEVTNKPNELIHVQHCYIKTLQITYGPNQQNEETLQFKIDSVKLTLKFNDKRKFQWHVHTNKKKERPTLKQFYRAVGTQEEYQERGFFQEEIHQLKRIFGEFLISKLSFSITNIDVSILCFIKKKPVYFGVTVEDIDFKHKIITRGHNEGVSIGFENRELHGELRNIGIYIAHEIQNQYKIKKKSALQKQFIKKQVKRHRKYLMNKQIITLFYNFEEKHLACVSKSLTLNIESILLYQLMEIINYIQFSIQIKPSLRPGEGKIKDIGEQKIVDHHGSIYQKKLKISEGTIQWWQILGSKIIDKFNNRQNLNLIKNKKFRRYLFCLLYRYTYGAKSQLQEIIDEYEFFKEDFQIIKYNMFVIQRVHKIQMSESEDIELKGFVVFLHTIVKTDPTLKKIRIKTLNYTNVKNSDVICNYHNSKKFMRIYENTQQDNINLDLKIGAVMINIFQSKESLHLKSEIANLNPAVYDLNKREILAKYCDYLIVGERGEHNISRQDMNSKINPLTELSQTKNKQSSQQVAKQTVIISLQIRQLTLDINPGNNIYFNFEHFQVSDLQTGCKIAKINNFLIALQNMHPEIYRWQVSVQQRLQFKIQMFFLHLDFSFIQKCLMIKSFITPPLIEQEIDTRNFLTKFINKKVPKHNIFSTYTSTSKYFNINQCILSIPVLDKNRTIELSLKGIEFEDPVNEKQTYSISKVFLIRSNLSNIKEKFKKRRREEKQTDKNILLVNTQPVSGYSSYTHHNMTLYVLIPFFLTQISCQDLFYLNNIMNCLSEIFNNLYYFPKPLIKKETNESIIQMTSVQFAQKMENQISYTNNIEFVFEGLQFYLVTDSFFDSDNKIFGALIDYVSFKRIETYTEDKIEFSIKDIFVTNCLGNQRINKNSLILSIRGLRNLDDSSIIYAEKNRSYYERRASQEKKDHVNPGQLLLYSQERSKSDKKKKQDLTEGFLYANTKSAVHLHAQKSISEIMMKIVPIFIFHNQIFFQEILSVLSIIQSLSADCIRAYFEHKQSSNAKSISMPQNSQTGFNQMMHQDQEIQTLKTKQFEQLTYLYINLARINLLVVEDKEVVSSITIKQFAIKHKTEPYLQKFNFSINRLIILDTSDEAGPYPMIFDAYYDENRRMVGGAPIVGSYISYNSQILRHRQKKSAYLYLKIFHPNINFLKKKILEVVNLLMNVLNKTLFKENSNNDKEQQQTNDKMNMKNRKKNNQKAPQKPNAEPTFCYYVEIVEPKIKLIRGSLSPEGFNSKADYIIVSNFTKDQFVDQQTDMMHQFTIATKRENQISIDIDLSKVQKTDKNYERDDEEFESCSRIHDENYEHFQSFSRIQKDKQLNQNIIYIKLGEFMILGSQFWDQTWDLFNPNNIHEKQPRSMVQIPVIALNFMDSTLSVIIPKFYGDMTEEDYRVLIRLTEDNFCESPILFTHIMPPAQQIRLSFRTAFQIEEMILNLRLKKEENNKKKEFIQRNLKLTIEGMKGKNQIWTNGENETELSIHNISFLKEDYSTFLGCRFYEKNSQKIPEKLVKIHCTNLDSIQEFRETEHINKKIWNKLCQNQGDYFQLFQTCQSPENLEDLQAIKGHATKQTNTQKISKWVAGMCKKCFKCCNCCIDDEDQQQKGIAAKKDTGQQFIDEEDFSDDLNILMSGQKNRNASIIYKLGDILDFEEKISPHKIEEKRMEKHLIYLDFVIKHNGEKHMYMQAKNLAITLEKQNSLLDAINFFNKPYSNPQIPPYVRIPKFNNFKPFKMVIQVNDTYLQLKNILESGNSDEHEFEKSFNQSPRTHPDKEEKVIILLDTIYDSEAKGDNNKGPGKSLLLIETLLQVLFISDRFEKPIELSNKMRIAYSTDDVTPYEDKEKKKSSQKILLIPQHSADRKVHIKIPVFLVKSFMRIMNNSVQKKEKQEQQGASVSKEKIQVQNEDRNRFKQSKEQQPQKKVQPHLKDKFTSRLIFISDLCFDVEYNLGNTFLATQLKNMKYAEAVYVQSNSQMSIKNIKSTIDIKYWNLKVGKFEPCLEPWAFKVTQINTLRDDISSNQLSIESNISKKNIIDDIYCNDLNLNFTIALFQNYKQLMIKFQEEDNEYIEQCYDLTTIESKQCNIFSGTLKKGQEDLKFFKDDFPIELKSYFGRIFKGQERYSIRKNAKLGNKNEFNPKQLNIYTYHSYFDHIRRKKRLTFRTPFRIFNCSTLDLQLVFMKMSRYSENQIKWTHKLKKLQYYSIPSLIYSSDFLVNFQLPYNLEKQVQHKYLSVKYLMETRAKTKRFKRLTEEDKLWKFIFKYSSRNSDKLLYQSDLLLNLGPIKLCAVTIKAQYQISSEKQDSLSRLVQDNKLYDTYAIIMSPVIIENYSYFNFKIKLNRIETIDIPSNERVQINHSFQDNFYDTIFEFEEDNFHQEFQFLKIEEKQTQILLEINKLQSLKLKIYRQTASTCQIEIYAEWNIENRTNHDFSFRFLERVFLIDRMSFSSLSNLPHSIDFSIIGEELECSKRIKTQNIVGQITLSKKLSENKQEKLLPSKLKHQTRKCCACLRNKSTIYQSIEFVLNMSNDQIFDESKRLQIKYKYQIRNLTSFKLRLFQFNSEFLIANLPNFEDTNYIFFYDFIPVLFFLQIYANETYLSSCKFDLQKFPGTSFAIKIKKKQQGIDLEQYYKRFYYLRFEIKRNGEEIFIDILDADLDNFPIYLDNLTDYTIKINENNEDFILKPQQRIPFTWSKLIQEENSLQVKIDNAASKQYKFNKKQAFEPIKIIDKNRKKKRKNQNLYKKELCYVSYEYMNIYGTCLLILDSFDNKLRIHNNEDGINIEIELQKIQRMEALASKIEMYNEDNQLIEIIPGSKSIKSWKQELHECINQHVIDKIFFTIQSYKNSRFLFFRTNAEDHNQSNKNQIIIKNLNLSVISSQPEEILLLNCENFSYTQHDRINRLNYKNLAEQISERVITLKKVKISNQTSIINPVVLSQIKKSNTPFLQIRLSKVNLLTLNENENFKTEVEEEVSNIVHYKQITVFMDEAEVMVQASLFSRLMNLKGNIDYLSNQYAFGEKSNEESQKKDQKLMISTKTQHKNTKLVKLKSQQNEEFQKVVQVYINFIEIKPLKMTVSVNMEHSEENEKNYIGVFRYIPLGVENAIIEIDSFTFFHVFFDQEQLTRLLTSYYMQSIQYQILYNAGSYDMLAPLKLIEGVGVGVKNIFYDPFYEFVKKKQIQAVGKKFCEGIISFIVLILSTLLRVISIIFKLIALLTFDRDFRTKRQTFRKQIFKSPLDGALLGGKNLWKVFKSFFTNFAMIGKNYKNIFGYFCGLILCIIKIVPWAIKLVVSLYDFLYVIGLGFINWGYYEQSAMKNRSRPPRILKQGKLNNYNFRYSYGHELIQRNNLQEISSQQIYFVKKISRKDDYNYLILSNYRILYNNNKITSCNEMKLYQINEVSTKQVENNKKIDVIMTIHLSIPNTNKIVCFSLNVDKYEIQFSHVKDAIKFIKRLQKMAYDQKLNIKFNISEGINRAINLEGGIVLIENILIEEKKQPNKKLSYHNNMLNLQ